MTDFLDTLKRAMTGMGGSGSSLANAQYTAGYTNTSYTNTWTGPNYYGNQHQMQMGVAPPQALDPASFMTHALVLLFGDHHELIQKELNRLEQLENVSTFLVVDDGTTMVADTSHGTLTTSTR